jgi:hypothetical protein
MYACDLYFIVTNNILQTQSSEYISEKYDLKGSSVYRNMRPPKHGQTARCKACGTLFTYNSKSHMRFNNDVESPEKVLRRTSLRLGSAKSRFDFDLKISF